MNGSTAINYLKCDLSNAICVDVSRVNTLGYSQEINLYAIYKLYENVTAVCQL